MELLHGSSNTLFSKQNVRRKLEVRMPAAMPCKTKRGKVQGTCRTSCLRKTKYACIVEVDESTRRRLEGTLHKNHEDHCGGKGIHSLKHHDLFVHNFCSHASSNENTRCESRCGQTIGKNRENITMATDESQKQERSDR